MRGDLERILDMIEMCDLSLTHASDPATLERGAVVQAAAQRRIEVLGEPASRVSEDLKAANPDIPWREIIGIRVVLARAYFHIDRDIANGGGASHECTAGQLTLHIFHARQVAHRRKPR